MGLGSWRTPIVVLLCGTLILCLSFGLRQNFGLYMAPISSDLGWGRETFAFAVAFQSLVCRSSDRSYSATLFNRARD